MSGAALARELGMQPSAVLRWEHEDRDLSSTRLAEVADALKVPRGEFFAGLVGSEQEFAAGIEAAERLLRLGTGARGCELSAPIYAQP